MRHQITSTTDERLSTSDRRGQPEPDGDRPFDDELQWLCLRVLVCLGKQAPSTAVASPTYLTEFMAHTYDGPCPDRFKHLCAGLSQMERRDFHGALVEFDTVLAGQVDGDFEVFRELALEAHAHCLEQLDYDDEALEEFTSLLVQKFAETRESGEADHVARLLGLCRLSPACRLEP